MEYTENSVRDLPNCTKNVRAKKNLPSEEGKLMLDINKDPSPLLCLFLFGAIYPCGQDLLYLPSSSLWLPHGLPTSIPPKQYPNFLLGCYAFPLL